MLQQNSKKGNTTTFSMRVTAVFENILNSFQCPTHFLKETKIKNASSGWKIYAVKCPKDQDFVFA